MKSKKMIKVVSLMAMLTACVVSGAFALNAKTASAENEEIFHELGASVRVSTDKGIRFAFGLPEDKTGDGYEIGTLVIPKKVLGDKVLNHNEDTEDAVEVDYAEIPCTKNWVPNGELKSAKDGYKYYNAALTEIPQMHYDTVLVARSYYVKEGVYTYSDPVERSIGYVASAALNDGYVDTDNILSDIVTAGYGETALMVEGTKDVIPVTETATFTASNEKGYLPVWSSSNTDVATVDKTGKVTAVKGGEATITATIAGKTASKSVYALGDGLYENQVGIRINGWNFSSNASYLTVSGDNGNMNVTSKFQANATYAPGIVLRNIYSKAYYQALVANGYTKFTFGLAVEGDVTDLYVFGKPVSSFPQEDGVYKIVIDTNHFVSYYDTIHTIATSGDQVGQSSSLSAKFIAWKSPADDWSSVRDYKFAISNAMFAAPTLSVDFAEGCKDMVAVGETTTLVAETNVNGVEWSSSDNAIATVENGVVTGVKGGEVTITATVAGLTVEKTVYVVGDGLYSNQIGIRINGWNFSSNADYLSVSDNNGNMVVTSKFQANVTYAPALVLRNIYSKAYYQALIANGYTKFTFGLAVEGDVTDLYVFGKQISSFPQKDGVYMVSIDTNHFVSYYDTINTIATSGSQVGQASSLTAKFIAWQSPANDWSTVRNYVFTISEPSFRTAATVAVDFATGSEATIVATNTTQLTATTNWNDGFVVWSSSDEAIATVDGNGLVTGVAAGEATITATVAGVSASKVVTVVAPTISIGFADDGKDMIEIDETTNLVVNTNGNAKEVEWISSDPAIATVENGVVMGMKGGEVTITATIAGVVSNSVTVYVVGDGLYSNQIGVHAYGWNQTNSATYFNMETGTNGEMIVTAKYAGSTTHYPSVVLRELYSKAYYENLIAAGYEKLTFTLAVGGANAGNVSDLYVFGKTLTSFPKNADGAYAIVLDLQYIVDNYAKVGGIGTSVEAKNAEVNYMLLAWKSTDWTARNYVFTISNAQFGKGVLFADNIGMRVNGWNMTTNTTYMTMDVDADGAMTITANWQAYKNYGPALVLKNIESKAYYQDLINSGITYLTFDLKVGGEDADKITDVHILGSAKKISELTKEGDVYKVQIQLAHIVQFYDTITTLDTSGNQAGQWGSRSALLLAWRFSTDFATVPADATRNYIFTISNSMYV